MNESRIPPPRADEASPRHAPPRENLKRDPEMPEELCKDTMRVAAAPERVLLEKANNNEPTPTPTPQQQTAAVAIPLVNEVQLTAATGGAELSCYRCTVPFGVVVLIAGIVVTAVAYSFNSHGSTISYFGLVLLSAGLVLLSLSAVCWKVRMDRKKERRRESQTALMTNHRSIFA
ncbi:transmembrane protein 100 [Chanos chanos]|uniref:Transmembrane protein 100 n=1 Tax=Chanos chanos TaxID=29144 RepID=A0A6J2WMP9_CHACN|nr:transmembrane protein 100 [Chanos chanos]